MTGERPATGESETTAHLRPIPPGEAVSRNRLPGPRLTRRSLLAGSSAAIAGTSLSHPLTAQEATPAGLDLEEFRTLCEWVTGIDAITDDAGLRELLDLFESDEQFTEGLAELVALDRSEAPNSRVLPFPATVTLTNILQYWYLGHLRNEPLPNLDERYPNLLSWQALPYATHPTVCKGFGYWATDPELPDRT